MLNLVEQLQQEDCHGYREKFTYDHVGRLLSQTQCIGDESMGDNCPTSGNLEVNLAVSGTIDTFREASNSITVTNATLLPGTHLRISNGSEEELIVYNGYDELGQLVQKKVGGAPGIDYASTAGLQTVDYGYNVRGWLKNINDPANLGDALFGFAIKYNDITDPLKRLYNGNIGQTLWNSQSPVTGSNPISSSYTYTYDALNRITSAIDNTTNYNLELVEYDRNGNIQRLKRKGHTNVGATTFGLMDDLEYAYIGNQLQAVDDDIASSATQGFVDGAQQTTEYTYDDNGNMKTDANKGITSIVYNHLNLPEQISINGNGNNGTIAYIYDATGTKMRKTVSTGTVTDYAGNFSYEGTPGNAQLQFFNTPEGYVMPRDADDYTQGFEYVFQYRDHMGNVRLSYTDANNDDDITTNEIIEENSYYPFGLKHQGYNNNVSSLGNSNAQKWKYQGQELTEDLGLGVYEFKYRMHDPAIGRFWQIDPLAEDYMYNSTYAFQENKLGIGIELEGLEVSRHEWLDDNGQNNIRYDAQIKVLNNSSASIDQVIKYANNIAGQIENDFSGTDSDGNNVSTSVSLEFVAEADPENDFYIEFTDQVIDPATGNPATAEGRADVIGDAEVNRMQVLIPGKSGASYGEPVTEDRLPFSGAHEYGHTVGLDHQVGSSNKSLRGLSVGPNNLMRSSNSLNRQRGGVNGGQLSVLQNTVNTPFMVNFRQQMRQSQQKFEKTMNKILNPKL